RGPPNGRSLRSSAPARTAARHKTAASDSSRRCRILFSGYEDGPAADAAAGVSYGLAKIIGFLMQNKRTPGHTRVSMTQSQSGDHRMQSAFAGRVDRDVSKIPGMRLGDPVLEHIAVRMAGRV